MPRSVHVVVISEEAGEREKLAQTLNDLWGEAIVTEVDRVSQMSRQAGQVEPDCVVLDIDRYPLAGTLGLAQARATFPDTRIIVLARSIPSRYLRFLRKSGASCCIDKDDAAHLTSVAQLVGVLSKMISRVRSTASKQSIRQAGGRTTGPARISA